MRKVHFTKHQTITVIEHVEAGRIVKYVSR